MQSRVEQEIEAKQLEVIFELFADHLVLENDQQLFDYLLKLSIKLHRVVDLKTLRDSLEKHLGQDDWLGEFFFLAETLSILAVVC